MDKVDTYAEIMRESETRKKYVTELISKIEMFLKIKFSKEEYDELYYILSYYEVEDGVTLFKPSSKPVDKKRIAVIKLAKNNLVLWW